MPKAKTPTQDKKPDLPVKPNIFKVRNRFIHQAPDKIRFAAKLIINIETNAAIAQLMFSPLSAKKPLIQTLKMALNELEAKNLSGEWFVKAVAVDEGPKLKRRRIVHQGRATSILKRMSHITIYLTNIPKPKINKKRSNRGS